MKRGEEGVAGKTTMIRTLLGLIAINSGSGRVRGGPLARVRAGHRLPRPRAQRQSFGSMSIV
jgi:ABC-type branched-subunit amino acid transport system ATPase component